MEESSALMSCHRGVSPVVDTRDKALLALMLGCGLRRAEVCGLTLADVSFNEGAITLIGKGNKERKVYLPEAAMKFLLVWLNFRGQENRPLFRRIFRRPLEGAASNPAGEGERFVERKNVVPAYFRASARRFTIIPEKRT